MAVRVILAEDNALLRHGLATLIERADGLELVGTATDRPSLEQAVLDHDPDVVVTDIRMPPSRSDEGIKVAGWLRRERPQVGVVVLSQHAEATYALALLEGGSAGRAYLLKERVAGVDDLLRAIRAVAAGESVIDPAVVEGLVAASARRQPSELERLTPRELEVLSHMAQGWSNAAIAAALVLSERAVEKHSNSIFAKLGLTDEPDLNRRVKAVLLFLHSGNHPAGGPTGKVATPTS
ncbi:DNA-binding response regulator [Frankia sp. CcI49]|uniref:DNA-binding response regulator, NarL/FixJ family, contains REC and HTH domains n=1 Tax=Parafrankia irregularis TaxID=795642 RepID=A0A0S4QWY9_9ACTN|nr:MULTISPECIES: response regulator transcription factor [Frankiaceae]KPM53523.1 LuxR family transcriptional regulator [Frankia sp. R43]MBE3203449.1 response regulator transcription factor [Parafrankia sp. CH37]ONH54866.1 DNA-binding response regulator [Frankia sp. CcI49]CUU60192.1 DNA-binding response regulator, NarL/FixJ family, contains REC and HTH domains [Parafrankia irregularis]